VLTTLPPPIRRVGLVVLLLVPVAVLGALWGGIRNAQDQSAAIRSLGTIKRRIALGDQEVMLSLAMFFPPCGVTYRGGPDWYFGTLADFGCLPYLGRPERLDLANTTARDADLAILQHLSTLETLDLSHTAITDAGLQHVASLDRLETIDLRETAVTRSGVMRLRQALPSATILH